MAMMWCSSGLLLLLASCSCALRVAVIGEGVIGLSTATALLDLVGSSPSSDNTSISELVVFHDRPFHEIVSSGVAGLFRIDKGTPLTRTWGNDTFLRLSSLFRDLGGLTGVQQVSGHILHDNMTTLMSQSDAYSDIVYNFRFLAQREMEQFAPALEDRDLKAIHYTAYTSEGGRYCPWMKSELIRRGVTFAQRHVQSLDQLADEGFDVVVNCAGLAGADLAADGDRTFPIRGVLLKTHATWQKHFLYREFSTFTIPTIDAVYVGTVKEEDAMEKALHVDEDREIFDRYVALQPAFRSVPVVDHFVHFRPGRVGGPRVQAEFRQSPSSGRVFRVVHNYGHGGNGFTLGWGTAVHAAHLALGLDDAKWRQL